MRVGDRVGRRVYMDDGTWMREGDACLDRSPLRLGRVRSIEPSTGFGPAIYEVAFDDGAVGRYFRHGIEPLSRMPRPGALGLADELSSQDLRDIEVTRARAREAGDG